MLLAGLLAVDALLHGLIVARFGLKGNEPPAGFGAVYLLLAVLAAMGLGFVTWASGIVALVGSAGLLANWGKIGHEKTIEQAILLLNAVIILYAVWRVLVG